MIKAQHLKVKLSGKTILSDLSFEAHPGQVTSIVGPNGSGKTTLLRAMTGDLAYTGRVEINGLDMQGQKPWELATVRGVLPQASALAFPFSVVEVVNIGLQGGRSGQSETVASAALSRVGLAGYAHRPYQELSGGEQQRVQLARVLAQIWHPVEDGEARWLFLDEPVSALDISHQLQVMNIARDFADQGGGVVAVMHDLNLTAMFSDKMVLMANGQIKAAGQVVEVLTNDHLSSAYGCSVAVNQTPNGSVPFILPQAAVA